MEPVLRSMQPLFEGSLPHQSAVYVVLDKDRRRVHVLPISIDPVFSVAKDQLDSSLYDGSNSTRVYLRAKCEELGVTNNQDKGGFYMGNNPLSLLEYLTFYWNLSSLNKPTRTSISLFPASATRFQMKLCRLPWVTFRILKNVPTGH